MMAKVSKPYLTVVEKAKIMNHLGERWDDVDVAIRPYVLKLNGIVGVVTIQSCAGHLVKSNGPVYHSNANLWIWLSKLMMKRFRKRAHELARVKGIDRLYIMYTPDDREYIDIDFDSVEERKRGLKAIRAIMRFFKSLADDV